MAEKNILSKPFTVTLQNTTGGISPSRYIFYSEVQGRQEGNNFLPKENSNSAEIFLYRKISELEYQALELRGSNLIKREGNLFLANDAIILDNKIFPTQIAPDNVQRNAESLKNTIIGTSEESIKSTNLNNNSNINPNTATIQETTPTSTAQISQPNLKREPSKIKTYPIDMRDSQDRIQFSVWKYSNRDISARTISIEEPQFEQISAEGFVYLPITKISDTNAVDWNDSQVNPLQSRLANLSLAAMRGNTEKIEDQGGKLLDIARGEEFGNLARIYLAGLAVGVGGLLTRASGAILNPNLELLFNSPTLREFSFSFDLIGKSSPEAERIKEIIKFFKKNMSVRDKVGDVTGNAESSIFLRSPYVFKLKYLAGAPSNQLNAVEHKSIGRIKTCALRGCTVDYTPMGSYMTFNDPNKTMFMYRLTLQFKELTPIYSSDYDEHPIGY